MAETAATSIEKGSRVIVVGKLDISSYEKDGNKVWTTKILADEIGLTMRFNAVFADKTERNLALVTEKFGAVPFLGNDSF